MRAAMADGAAGVVWVTLNEERSGYRRINAYSAGKPWFGPDGLHLSASGASALAGFLRPYVIRAAGPRRPRLR